MSHPDNRVKFWTDCRFNGLDLLRASFAKHDFAPHVHDEMVIAVTEKGAGRFRSNRRVDIAAPHSVLVFNPGETHSGGVLRDQIWRYRALYVQPELCKELCEALLCDKRELPYFGQNRIDDTLLANAIVALHEALEIHEGRLSVECALLDALANLVKRYAQTGKRFEFSAPANKKMQIVRDYMEENFSSDVSLEGLANLAKISQFHLIRSFAKRFGLPPCAYLTQIRLRQAKRLLAAGNLIADVAVSLGFYDQSHLIKHFKRTYGMTPGQYAAAWRS